MGYNNNKGKKDNNEFYDYRIYKDGIYPLLNYVRIAIETLNKKKVSCKWEKYDTSNIYKLIKNYYQALPYYTIKLKYKNYKILHCLDNEDNIDISTAEKFKKNLIADNGKFILETGKGADRKKIEILEDNINFDNLYFKTEEILNEDSYDAKGYKIDIEELLTDGIEKVGDEYRLYTYEEDKNIEKDKNIEILSKPYGNIKSAFYNEEEKIKLEKQNYKLVDKTEDKLKEYKLELKDNKIEVQDKSILEKLKSAGFELKEESKDSNFKIRLIEIEKKKMKKMQNLT